MAPVTDAAAPSTATRSTIGTTEWRKMSGIVAATSTRPPADQETPGVVGVDQPPDRAGEQQQRDDPGGQQQRHLVGMGAVGLQAQRQGDERHPVAERRDHAPREGNDQVTASREMLSIC